MNSRGKAAIYVSDKTSDPEYQQVKPQKKHQTHPYLTSVFHVWLHARALKKTKQTKLHQTKTHTAQQTHETSAAEVDVTRGPENNVFRNIAENLFSTNSEVTLGNYVFRNNRGIWRE